MRRKLNNPGSVPSTVTLMEHSDRIFIVIFHGQQLKAESKISIFHSTGVILEWHRIPFLDLKMV